MKKRKTHKFISFLVGFIIFGITIWYFGLDSLNHVYQHIKPIYLIPFLAVLGLTFVVNAWRLQVILKAYNIKIPLMTALKQNLAGYAVAYVTPSARIGGEPIKAYMLNKECDIDIKKATSAVILDKFTELLGSITIGAIGFAMLYFLPNIPNIFKLILGLIILFIISILFAIYYFSIKGKGPFTSLFNMLRFYKIPKWKNLGEIIVEIEKHMEEFFHKNHKEFFLSYFAYGLYGALTLLEFKFIYLALGVNMSIAEIIIVIVVWGMINFVPVPAAIGFQEASQSGLTSLLRGAGGVGFAFSLITRIGTMIFVSIGFAILSNFGGKEFMQKYKSEKELSKE